MLEYLANPKTKNLVLLGVVGGCFLSEKLGPLLGVPFSMTGLIWPLLAIAIIFITVFGSSIWAEVWLGGFLGIATSPLSSLNTLGIGLVIATVAVLQALLLANIIRPLIFKGRFASAQGILLYLGIAIPIALSYGIFSLIFGRTQGVSIAWPHFVHDKSIEDLLALLLATPFFLPLPTMKSRSRILEGCLLIAITLLINNPFIGVPTLFPLRGALMCPVALWAILRFGYLGISAIGFFTAMGALWTASHGRIPLAAYLYNDPLFVFHIQLVTVMAIALIIAAILEDRRNALLALHESNQEMEKRVQERTKELAHFKFIIDHAAEEFFLANMDGTFAYVNETGARNLGYTQDEIMQLSVADIAPSFTLPKHQGYKQVLPPPFESTFKLKDGGMIPTEVRLASLTIQGEDYICGFAHNITKRKQTQMVIQRERDLAQQYLDIMAVLLVVVDPEGKIQLINKRGCQILGYSEKELLGKSWIDYCVPETSQKEVQDLFQQLLNGEKIENHCNLILTHSGEKRLIGFRNCLLQENGQITGIIFSGEDITECQRAKAALTESEKKFRMLAESSPTAIVILKGEEIRYLNPATTKITGYTQDELTPERFISMLHPEERQQILEMIDRYHVGAKPQNLSEFRIIRKDGAVRWLGLRANLISFEGAPALLCSIADFTSEIEAIEKIKESEEKYRKLFSAVSDAIFIVDAQDFSLLDCNSRATEVFGYTLEEHQALGPGSFPSLTNDAIQKLELAKTEGTQLFEWPAKKKTGETFWTEVNMHPLLIGDQKRIIVVVRDISERKRAEEWSKEQEKIEALKEGERLKDQFLSIISHELRTPLNAVMGFGSLLEDGVFGPLALQQADAVSKILEGANRMLKLVNDLLDLAKLQAGQLDFNFDEINYSELVEEAIAFLQPIADQKKIQVHSKIQVSDCVSVDGERIFQLISNLISNAIKFSSPGEAIQIQAYQENDWLVTEVTDNGLGIAEEDIPKLFERFKQLDMSLTRKIGGSGLGLSISKGIAEGHGGRIEAMSPGLGQGSTFRFLLPLNA